MKRATLVIAVLALTAAVLPSAHGHHTAGWHWRRSSNPVEVRVINGATGTWESTINGAARRWSNKSTVIDLAVENGAGGCGPVNNAVKVCSGNFSGGWAGLTEVALNGAHIQWATVKLDNSALVAARAVSCHELGHSIGLGHRPQSDSTSCMTGSLSSSQRSPDTHDLAMLKRIYRHGDGSAAEAQDFRIVRIYTYL